MSFDKGISLGIISEELLHFFIECRIAQDILRQVEEALLKCKFKQNVSAFNTHSILFSKHTEDDFTTVCISNFVCLLLKVLMYNTRCKSVKLSIEEIIYQIDKYRKYESYNAKECNKTEIYFKNGITKNRFE